MEVAELSGMPCCVSQVSMRYSGSECEPAKVRSPKTRNRPSDTALKQGRAPRRHEFERRGQPAVLISATHNDPGFVLTVRLRSILQWQGAGSVGGEHIDLLISADLDVC